MSYTVLVVDDSPTMRGMVKRAISMSGVDVGMVHEAGNGREALQLLAAHWIDVVFADLNMPEMSGFELVDRMADDRLLAATPVVIVSSEQSDARSAQLKGRGVAGYIKKPFRPELLRDVIHQVLGHVAEAD
jgi:two-component system chemotaxis response regulator CheY